MAGSQLHDHGQGWTQIECLVSPAMVDLNLQKMLVAGRGSQNAVLESDAGRIGEQLRRREETNTADVGGAILMRHKVLHAMLPVNEGEMHPHWFFERSLSNVEAQLRRKVSRPVFPG